MQALAWMSSCTFWNKEQVDKGLRKINKQTFCHDKDNLLKIGVLVYGARVLPGNERVGAALAAIVAIAAPAARSKASNGSRGANYRMGKETTNRV